MIDEIKNKMSKKVKYNEIIYDIVGLVDINNTYFAIIRKDIDIQYISIENKGNITYNLVPHKLDLNIKQVKYHILMQYIIQIITFFLKTNADINGIIKEINDTIKNKLNSNIFLNNIFSIEDDTINLLEHFNQKIKDTININNFQNFIINDTKYIRYQDNEGKDQILNNSIIYKKNERKGGNLEHSQINNEFITDPSSITYLSKETKTR